MNSFRPLVYRPAEPNATGYICRFSGLFQFQLSAFINLRRLRHDESDIGLAIRSYFWIADYSRVVDLGVPTRPKFSWADSSG
jgi:hypothetical protein